MARHQTDRHIHTALLLTLIMLPAGSAQAATKIKGIDVSRWQGKVDWKKVKASGVEFVMLGIGRYHNGVRVPDTEFTITLQMHWQMVFTLVYIFIPRQVM